MYLKDKKMSNHEFYMYVCLKLLLKVKRLDELRTFNAS